MNFSETNDFQIKEFQLHEKVINSLAISQKNKILITSGEDKTIKIFDIVIEQEVKSLASPCDIYCIRVSPDEKMFAYGGKDNCLRIRLFERYKLHRIFEKIKWHI